MRARRGLWLALSFFSLLAASCGDERQANRAAQVSTNEDPTFLKQDYYGALKVPPGTQLISLVHTDPYVWNAKLAFSGVSATEVVQNLREQLDDLEFHTDLAEGVLCTIGELRADKTGSCFVRAYVAGDGGYIEIRVSQLNVTLPGEVTMMREFYHRRRDDPIGPPVPDYAD